MDTEYFDDSWNVKVEQFRRFLRTLFRETIRKCRSKRRGYTRFLTDDEKRWLARNEYDLSARFGIPYGP